MRFRFPKQNRGSFRFHRPFLPKMRPSAPSLPIETVSTGSSDCGSSTDSSLTANPESMRPGLGSGVVFSRCFMIEWAAILGALLRDILELPVSQDFFKGGRLRVNRVVSGGVRYRIWDFSSNFQFSWIRIFKQICLKISVIQSLKLQYSHTHRVTGSKDTSCSLFSTTTECNKRSDMTTRAQRRRDHRESTQFHPSGLCRLRGSL